MLKKTDFKDIARWQQVTEYLKLPKRRDEIAIVRVPGLLPVAEGSEIKQSYNIADDWLVGENINGSRQYIIHIALPRFIAEILDDSDRMRLAPLQWQMQNGQWLSDFLWIDKPPEDLTILINEAEEFIEEYDANLGVNQ